jgi:uncharacterized membrane protein YvbJ
LKNLNTILRSNIYITFELEQISDFCKKVKSVEILFKAINVSDQSKINNILSYSLDPLVKARRQLSILQNLFKQPSDSENLKKIMNNPFEI